MTKQEANKQDWASAFFSHFRDTHDSTHPFQNEMWLLVGTHAEPWCPPHVK